MYVCMYVCMYVRMYARATAAILIQPMKPYTDRLNPSKVRIAANPYKPS